MSDAHMYAGITKGLVQTQEYIRDTDNRNARRAEAKARQKQAEEFVNNAELRKTKSELELEATKAQLTKLNNQTLRDNTYSAFRRYEGDKDVRHINSFLADAKNNPAGQRMYGELARVDKLTRSPQTEAMLSRAGIQDINGYFNDPDKNGNFLLGTGKDGNQKLINLDNVYAASGFTKVMQADQLESMRMRNQAMQLQSTGMTYDKMGTTLQAAHMIKDELGIPLNEALQKVRAGNAAGGSAIERLAKTIQEENPSMSWVDAVKKAGETMRAGSSQEREADKLMKENPGMTREEAMNQGRKNTQPNTSVNKNLEQAEGAREKLDEIAGGDFLSADMNDPKVRSAAGRHVTALEKLTGKSLSNQDKRVVRDMRELTHLGKTAGEEIGEEETGLIDNMFNNFKKYMSNEVDTVVGTSAYETFRNSIRHALYGATLSQGEIAAFNAAAGNLGQQAGPVLQQLATQLSTVKGQLQSVYDTNDEYVAKYYLGSSLEEIDQVIEQIEKRIELTNVDSVGEVQTKPPGERRSLDDIFGGKS
jgi:hypothetical protein